MTKAIYVCAVSLGLIVGGCAGDEPAMKEEVKAEKKTGTDKKGKKDQKGKKKASKLPPTPGDDHPKELPKETINQKKEKAAGKALDKKESVSLKTGSGGSAKEDSAAKSEGGARGEAEPSKPATLYVTTTGLNVRSGPSMQSPVINVLGFQDEVQDLGREGIWVKTARDAYVSSHYVSATLPEVPNDPVVEEPEDEAPGADGEMTASQPEGGADGMASDGMASDGMASGARGPEGASESSGSPDDEKGDGMSADSPGAAIESAGGSSSAEPEGGNSPD